MKKKKPQLFWIAFCFLATCFNSFGQPGQGPGGGTKPGSVPITGIEILLGIGSLFGVSRLLTKAKNKQS